MKLKEFWPVYEVTVPVLGKGIATDVVYTEGMLSYHNTERYIAIQGSLEGESVDTFKVNGAPHIGIVKFRRLTPDILKAMGDSVYWKPGDKVPDTQEAIDEFYSKT